MQKQTKKKNNKKLGQNLFKLNVTTKKNKKIKKKLVVTVKGLKAKYM